MKREELDRRFDEALGQALDTKKWNAGGMLAFGVAALAIAVRGLWSDVASSTRSLPVDERDFGPPVNQGGG